MEDTPVKSTYVPLAEVLPQIRIYRANVYECIANNDFPLPLLKVGKRWFVRPADVEAYNERPECRDHFCPPGDVALNVWDRVHHLAHVRVPFTVDAFAALADCPAVEARQAIEAGVERDWFAPSSSDPERWVGLLPARKNLE